ncbi:MAG: hypothetical protein KIT17_00505 [Rubrivivax sp.]|nr:hypothetical protein [Rubrivivax sp.]
MAELTSLAGGQAALHFGSTQDWVVAADWAADRPFFCAAVPASCELRLVALGGRHVGQRTFSSLAALLNLCRHLLPPAGWAWIRDHDRGHCLRFARGAVDYCRTTVHGEVLTEAECEEAAQTELRTAVALAGPRPADVRVIVIPELAPGKASRGTSQVLGLGMDRSANSGAAWALTVACALCAPER